MKPLVLTVKTDNYVVLSGDLTFATIHKKTVQLIDFKKIKSEVVLDLAEVKNSDSAGLALLIEWLKLSKKNKVQLKFDNIPQQLLTLATLSGFDLQAAL